MSKEDREQIHLSGSYSDRKQHRQELVEGRRQRKARRQRILRRVTGIVAISVAAALLLWFSWPHITKVVRDTRQNITRWAEERREQREAARAAAEASRAAAEASREAAESAQAAREAGEEAEASGKPADTAAADTEPAADTMVAAAELPKSFAPHAIPGTEPENLIASTEVMVDEEILSETETFAPWYHMDFGAGSEYTDVQGVVTFRGNSFRDAPAYGTANLTEHRFENLWTRKTGSRTYKEKTWTGSGWTGQPLIARWPQETKAVMNMYDWAKEKEDLVEVIYACLDGKIYFLDLETGEPTRDVLDIGFTFKGSGALDPRGLPILYVGAGYHSTNGRARVFVISLVDGSVLYTFGDSDGFADRSTSFFDSSPLVDASSDTLIYPGENGVLYLIHLNTQFSKTAGTLSVSPDHIAKWKYRGTRTGDKYWLGMETSPAIYKGYLFIADNGGNLMCLDLNTLKLVWVQDTLDDTNSTPVLSAEDGKLYLYISTSFHLGWRSSRTAIVPVWKIDAETGRIVWQKDYECHTQDGVSGGVQSTIAIGRGELSDYIYVTVSMTKDTGHGVLACIDKKTGEAAWEHEASYAWSSPICANDETGHGAVLYCSASGKFYLLNGLNGEEYDVYDLGRVTVEASPAMFDSYVVLGTRDCRICGFELK